MFLIIIKRAVLEIDVYSPLECKTTRLSVEMSLLIVVLLLEWRFFYIWIIVSLYISHESLFFH